MKRKEAEEPTYEDFEQQYRTRLKDLKRPTVLVAGYTGSGKTTLIQAICGKEVVPDDKIGAGLPKTQAFDFYESDLIRFFDSKGLEPGDAEQKFVDDAKRFVRDLQERPNVDDHVHVVWYVVQGPGARVTPCDLRLIKDIFPNVIVVITKNDITRPDQCEGMTRVLTDAGVPARRIVACAESDPASLRAVVELSFELLPEAYREAFVAAQRIHLDRKKTAAQAVIAAAAVAAAAAGAVPIPFSDAAIITPIQLAMVAGLAVIYGEPADGLRAAAWPLVAEAIGIQTAASLTKLIPGLGSVINAAVAFGLTEAVGQITNAQLVQRCEARINGKPVPESKFEVGEFAQAYKAARKKRCE